MVVCNDCGSTDVEVKAWVNPNNDNEYKGSYDDDDGYCNDCGEAGKSIVDKDTWDSDNRCDECNEINSGSTSDCECSFCTECEENETAGECTCEKCDECNDTVKECTCEPKEEENDVVEEVVPVPVVYGTGGAEEESEMSIFYCNDCHYQFEAISTMCMCEKCLSDNIRRV